MNTGKLLFIATLLFISVSCRNAGISNQDEKRSFGESDKDTETGLVIDQHLNLVKSQCTACHSAKIITMNRFTREGWQDRIRWMQKTQNLWDLGENEELILDYLSKNYSPEKQVSRRKNLEISEWYVIEN
jgi:hypothetical protein